MWGGSGTKVTGTLNTTDGGKTWSMGQTGVEADFGYAIPYTLTYFRAGGDGRPADAIQNTVDGGQTWANIYGPVSGAYLSDAIAGDGCVVYAQTMKSRGADSTGLLRSTDQGNTWSCIQGPVGSDDQPICGVMSRGATCIAMTYKSYNHIFLPDTVWKYTDASLLRAVRKDLQVKKFFPDTISITQCDSLLLKIQSSFTGCDFVRFHNLTIDSLSPLLYKTFFTKDKILRNGLKDTSSVKLLPDTAGVYHLFIHVNFAATDWSGTDTIFPLTLIVKPNPAVLDISKRVFDFGTKPLCLAPQKDTLILSNPGCYSTIINYIRWEPDTIYNADFSFSNGFPIVLKRDKPTDKILIDFHPQTPGEKKWKLIIESTVGNDTIPVIASVLPNSRNFSNKCDSIVCPLCDTGTGFLHLYNNSCREMSLDTIIVPEPYELLQNIFPLLLSYNDSLILPVKLRPSQRGINVLSAIAKLRYFEPGDTTAFDTTFTLIGYATQGASSYALSASAAVFDTTHLCDSARKRIVLYSTGCDSLPLSAVSLSGDSDFRVSGVGYRMSEIATGDSTVFDVLLNPISTGDKSGVITIILQDSTKVNIPVSATVIRAVRTLSSSDSLIDFGTQLICENRDTLLVLHNSGCDTVRVSGVGFRGSGFSSAAQFPIILLPGHDTTIEVFTLLDTAGGNKSDTSYVTYGSDADNTLAPVMLTRSYFYPQPVHLWLDADRTPLPDTSTWIVKLKSYDAGLASVNQIDFTLGYDTDLLGYLPNKSSVSSSDGKTFHLSGNMTIAADSSIGQIAFQVFLTKDTTTDLVFQNIMLNASDPKFMECEVFPLSAGITFNYKDICGDGAIRSILRGEPIKFSIRPNPAQDRITILFSSPGDPPISPSVYDALGQEFSLPILSTKPNELLLDTKILCGGVYLLRIGNARQSFVKMQ